MVVVFFFLRDDMDVLAFFVASFGSNKLDIFTDLYK